MSTLNDYFSSESGSNIQNHIGYGYGYRGMDTKIRLSKDKLLTGVAATFSGV